MKTTAPNARRRRAPRLVKLDVRGRQRRAAAEMMADIARQLRAGGLDGVVGVAYRHTEDGGIAMSVFNTPERSALEGLATVAMLDYARARTWAETMSPEGEEYE